MKRIEALKGGLHTDSAVALLSPEDRSRPRRGDFLILDAAAVRQGVLSMRLVHCPAEPVESPVSCVLHVVLNQGPSSYRIGSYSFESLSEPASSGDRRYTIGRLIEVDTSVQELELPDGELNLDEFELICLSWSEAVRMCNEIRVVERLLPQPPEALSWGDDVRPRIRTAEGHEFVFLKGPRVTVEGDLQMSLIQASGPLGMINEPIGKHYLNLAAGNFVLPLGVVELRAGLIPNPLVDDPAVIHLALGMPKSEIYEMRLVFASRILPSGPVPLELLSFSASQ